MRFEKSYLCYTRDMAAGKKRPVKLVKITDEAIIVRCASGDGMIREEMWQDEKGNTAR
jgi:hypothetical protein